MPTASEKEIIELTDVVEEGHPDQPNLAPQSPSPPSDEVLDDLDLEKEIDQIFADLGSPPEESTSGDSGQSLGDDLNLDDLFGASEPSGREKPQNVREGLAEPQETTVEAVGGGVPADMAGPKPEAPLSFEPEAPARASSDADQLAPLLERLAVMEERIARMDEAGQAVSGQVETRLSSLAAEFADKLREQADSLRRELRDELERDIGQMVRDALEEAKAQHMEEFSRLLAAQGEEAAARMESRFQELRNQEAPPGQDIAGAVAGQMEELRAGLLRELQQAVPAAAARIIREEIQALTQEG